MSTAHAIEPASGPTTRRLLAPDVSRGLMLLSIAVANSLLAWSLASGGARPPASGLDTAASVFATTVAEVRGLPMFSLLLGYGIGMVLMRESARGSSWQETRNLLLRRHFWLGVFGAVHIMFLFWGDILVTYALLGIAATLMARLTNRVLLWVAGVTAILYATGTIAMAFAMDLILGDQSTATAASGGPAQVITGTDLLLGDGYVTGQMLTGGIMLIASPLVAILAGFQLLPLILVGLAAARRRVLEDPAAHHGMLISVAVIGLTAAVATGVPAGLWQGADGSLTWTIASQIVGLLAGPGIVATVALVCLPAQRRVDAGGRIPVALRPLLALGRRSMSGYVTQSVLFTAFATPWGFTHPGDGSSTATWVGVGIAVWLATVIGATALDAAGKQGPLETLIRGLTYGPRTTQPGPPAPPSPPSPPAPRG